MTGVEVLDARCDASGGYKVDVSRGQRIGRVSSEWFSRPADERYLSLSELFGSVKRRTERSRTRTVESAAVRVEASRDDAEALSIANDTLYGLGAGVWSRDINRCYRFGRAIQAGRVWTNCYHAYPAHAALGGYKQSGIGRETHKMMLSHYQQTKNMLVSYSPKKLGFF